MHGILYDMQESSGKAVKIEITHRTIIFAFLLFIGLRFFTLVSDIILTIFVALLIMAILNPIVTKLARHKIPRPLSVLVVYVLVLAIVVISFWALIPPLITQTTTFINHFPDYIANLGIPYLYSEQVIEQIISQLGAIPAKAAQITISVFSNLLELITLLVFAFYLLMMRERLDVHLAPFFNDGLKKEIGRIIDILENRLGGWARGQLLLMLAVGATNYIGFTILGIPFALPLAIFAGLLELVPYIGPFIAAGPAVFIGFGISPFLGFATAALAFLIQQLENYVFVPKIMQKSAGVNPIVTLIALAVGFNIAGITGLLISVPCAITLEVLAREWYFSKK
jgi:predicted PurR-regulated permease PerM